MSEATKVTWSMDGGKRRGSAEDADGNVIRSAVIYYDDDDGSYVAEMFDKVDSDNTLWTIRASFTESEMVAIAFLQHGPVTPESELKIDEMYGRRIWQFTGAAGTISVHLQRSHDAVHDGLRLVRVDADGRVREVSGTIANHGIVPLDGE